VIYTTATVEIIESASDSSNTKDVNIEAYNTIDSSDKPAEQKEEPTVTDYKESSWSQHDDSNNTGNRTHISTSVYVLSLLASCLSILKQMHSFR